MPNTKRIKKEPKRTRSLQKVERGFYKEESGKEDLYRVRFSVPARFLACILLLLFVWQPVEIVFAASEDERADSGETTEAVASVSIPSVRQQVEDGPLPPQTPSAEADHEENSMVTPEEEGVQEVVADTAEDTSTEVVSEAYQSQVSAEAEPALPPVSETSSSSDSISTTSSSTEHVSEGAGEEVEDLVSATSTQPEVQPDEEEVSFSSEEPLPEEGAVLEEEESGVSTTTSLEVTVEMPEVSTGFNDQNRYQFGIDECVTVENGFFYCAKKDIPKITTEDKVYAAQDADGDYEIFISKDGVDTQITHNTYDDSAPVYDEKSDRLAWHALINDRYQILVYNFNTEQMEQLTHETYNSMQPAVLGDRIAWQSWINNNWEIVVDESGSRTQLTNNTTQDIAPRMRGDLISWQSETGDTRDITIYNIKTRETDVVKGAGGTDAANPRFLLVYDSTQENGDVATVGYDPETGEVVPLAAVPASAPREIPEPEHSKEKGAFVQTIPTIKNEIEGDVDDTVGTTTVSGGGDNLPGDVVVSPVVSAATSAAIGENASSSMVVPGGMELDLRDIATSTGEVAEHVIPDLVIPARTSVESISANSALE